jgi:hypothetical protein
MKTESILKQVNVGDLARLLKSHTELSDHVVVLTAVVGAMVTKASVDYERLEDCVNFAAKRMRPAHRPALLERASAILHDLEAMQKALGIENRKQRNLKKRKVAALGRQTL